MKKRKLAPNAMYRYFHADFLSDVLDSSSRRYRFEILRPSGGICCKYKYTNIKMRRFTDKKIARCAHTSGVLALRHGKKARAQSMAATATPDARDISDGAEECGPMNASTSSSHTAWEIKHTKRQRPKEEEKKKKSKQT